jgi:hypothetical protein
VDQHVETAERRQRRVDDSVGSLGETKVAGKELDAMPLAFEGRPLLLVGVGDHEPCPGAVEFLHDTAPDSARSASHDRDFPGQECLFGHGLLTSHWAKGSEDHGTAGR